jgi:hypothetical protein
LVLELLHEDPAPHEAICLQHLDPELAAEVPDDQVKRRRTEALSLLTLVDEQLP